MSGSTNEFLSTLQTASINHHPDPAYDINPGTSASSKIPVHISPSSHSDPHGPVAHAASPTHNHPHPSDDTIPLDVLQPAPRATLPPLPDLRFEQSYLARISTCQNPWSVAWVTLLDHVLMPLSQGVVWNLALFGWRAWNTGVSFKGAGAGARVRRWWWGVNNWKLPER